MTFVQPDWFTGMLAYGFIYALPMVLGIAIIILATLKDLNMKILGIGIVVMILAIPCSSLIVYEMFEVPSVQEKVITVQEWQPKPGLQIHDGMMVINSADDLMLITTDNEGFLNEENFLFGKFNTRDIFNELKVNGTYKIKYYGWREGYNSGFPNILAVEEVINETNASSNDYNKYFGNVFVSSN